MSAISSMANQDSVADTYTYIITQYTHIISTTNEAQRCKTSCNQSACAVS
jgi:hypothetical protein